MDPEELRVLGGVDLGTILRILKDFNEKHSRTFAFSSFSENDRKLLGEIVQEKLGKDEYASIQLPLLETLKIIARDPKGLEHIISDQLLEKLASLAKLRKESRASLPNASEMPVVTEVQKALCNLVFHSKSAQRFFSREEFLESLISRISLNKDGARWPVENQMFDVKLLFILTIYCADIRPFLRKDCHAIQDLCVYCSLLAEHQPAGVAEIGVINELLKVLYNLVYSIKDTHITMMEEMDFVILGQLSRELLIGDFPEDTKKHAINLITAMKKHGHSQLITPLEESESGKVPFKGYDLGAVDVILRLLASQLPEEGASTDENLAPIITALAQASESVVVVRRYVKSVVLPPLHDVHTRPEVGTKLRNKLVRLLTSTRPTVRDSAGDLLYILCKKDLYRLIKYTGYGNAAGWLADRGMMGLPRNLENVGNDEEDSESETEEYLAHKSQIDPVMGVVKEEHPDPMAGMSEEQKEQISMDLVNALDKMIRRGDIKPAAIDKSGRPVPIEHMEQFREEVLKKQGSSENKDGSDREE